MSGTHLPRDPENPAWRPRGTCPLDQAIQDAGLASAAGLRWNSRSSVISMDYAFLGSFGIWNILPGVDQKFLCLCCWSWFISIVFALASLRTTWNSKSKALKLEAPSEHLWLCSCGNRLPSSGDGPQGRDRGTVPRCPGLPHPALLF